jgi:cytochrome c peroxidase
MSKLSRYLGATFDLKTASRAVVSVATLRHRCADELAQKALESVALFNGSCSSCHVGGTGTDNNDGKLHPPSETGMDAAYAARTANKAYRTTPLRGLWQHAPYFHDGSAATLRDVVARDVVAHYNRVRNLRLNPEQQRDLVEYLKTL